MWKNTVSIHSILKEKKLQSEIFNQLNIKKKLKKKEKRGKKKCITDYYCNPRSIGCE
jgi:hypothetical protein